MEFLINLVITKMLNELKIIPITAENIDQCVAVFMESYNQPPWNYQWTLVRAKEYLMEYLGSAHFVGFVFYDQGVPVGAFLGHKKTWWTNSQLMIDEFFISPNKQRLGLGKSMMDYSYQYAEREKLELVVLMTNKYMPAYKFYNKIGFTTMEQFVFMFNQVPQQP